MSKVYDATKEFQPIPKGKGSRFHPNKHVPKAHPVSGKHGWPRERGES